MEGTSWLTFTIDNEGKINILSFIMATDALRITNSALKITVLHGI